MRLTMLLSGIPLGILQLSAIALWITNGFWWLFAAWACLAIPYGIIVSHYYFTHTAYICPECHEVFRPSFKEAFWAYHTPSMRRLTCPKCARRGLCVEVYAETKERQKNG